VVAGQGDGQESGSKGYGGREGFARFIEAKAWREAAMARSARAGQSRIGAGAGRWKWIVVLAPAGLA